MVIPTAKPVSDTAVSDTAATTTEYVDEGSIATAPVEVRDASSDVNKTRGDVDVPHTVEVSTTVEVREDSTINETAPAKLESSEGDSSSNSSSSGSSNIDNATADTAAEAEREEKRLREIILEQQLRANLQGKVLGGRNTPRALRTQSTEGDVSAPSASPRQTNPSSSSPSTSSSPPTTHVRIDNFQRPLNQKNLLRWLSDKIGSDLKDSDIWINGIKTHCYLDLGSVEEAKRCIDAVTGQKYPETNTMLLSAHFTRVTVAEAPSSAEAALKPGEWRSPAPAPAPAPVPAAFPLAVSPRAAPLTSPGGLRGSTPTAVGGVDLFRKAAASAADSARSAPLLGPGTDRTRSIRGDATTGFSTKRHRLESGLEANDNVDTSAETSSSRGDLQVGDRKGRLALKIEEELKIGKSLAEAQGKSGSVEQAASLAHDELELSLEDLFRKTESSPQIYWLPVAETEAASRRAMMDSAGDGSLFVAAWQKENHHAQARSGPRIVVPAGSTSGAVASLIEGGGGGRVGDKGREVRTAGLSDGAKWPRLNEDREPETSGWRNGGENRGREGGGGGRGRRGGGGGGGGGGFGRRR